VASLAGGGFGGSHRISPGSRRGTDPEKSRTTFSLAGLIIRREGFARRRFGDLQHLHQSSSIQPIEQAFQGNLVRLTGVRVGIAVAARTSDPTKIHNEQSGVDRVKLARFREKKL
jgi:hypothetical protein